MKNRYFLILISAFISYLPATELSASNAATAQDTITTFTWPEIPAFLTDPAARSEYLAKHFWDYTHFADTNYIHHPDITEQAWVDYCNLLQKISLPIAQQAIQKTIEKAYPYKKMYVYLTDLAEKYLYNPNSPLRNEELFIPVLESMIASPATQQVEKIRPAALLKLTKRNRIGNKATNFSYTLSSGQKKRLYDTPCEYMILFFNNPGCHACMESIQQLNLSTIIQQFLTKKKLCILSLYTDEEWEEWRKGLDKYPKNWINAYDEKLIIRQQELYDLKAIPTLYLLDKDKKVILKDTTVEIIQQYLARLIAQNK